MAIYRTRLQGRDPDRFALRQEEAVQMFEVGFHFSIYGEEGEYRLSKPYELERRSDTDEILIRQH